MPERSRKVEVTEQTSGRRADAWLSLRFQQWSRSQMAAAIRAGQVRSDRRTLKPSSLLQTGEVLQITIPGIAPRGDPPPPPPAIYEDERLLVVSKPPGILCHPAGDRWEWGIIGLIRDSRPEPEIELGHRLDRDTSGVLVLTLDRAANAWIKDQLRHRSESIRKEYLAIVIGHPNWTDLTVDAPIGDQSESEVRLRRGVVRDGLPAKTSFRVVKKMEGLSLVHCLLHTGRTHQIRVHLDHIGHPILGDRLYGQPDEVFLEWMEHRAVSDANTEPDNPHFRRVRAAVGFPRQALHAWRMQIPHPDGGTIEVEAKLPSDMQEVIDGVSPDWPDPDACPLADNAQS